MTGRVSSQICEGVGNQLGNTKSRFDLVDLDSDRPRAAKADVCAVFVAADFVAKR
jgi:hypothetical protein